MLAETTEKTFCTSQEFVLMLCMKMSMNVFSRPHMFSGLACLRYTANLVSFYGRKKCGYLLLPDHVWDYFPFLLFFPRALGMSDRLHQLLSIHQYGGYGGTI